MDTLDTPFYVHCPWPYNHLLAFWDSFFAQANNYNSLFALNVWFLPQTALALNSRFSDFGRP